MLAAAATTHNTTNTTDSDDDDDAEDDEDDDDGEVIDDEDDDKSDQVKTVKQNVTEWSHLNDNKVRSVRGCEGECVCAAGSSVLAAGGACVSVWTMYVVSATCMAFAVFPVNPLHASLACHTHTPLLFTSLLSTPPP